MAGLGALRPGRRSGASTPRLLAVLLVLALGVLFAAPARAVDYGHDVSWPQCPGGLPMPPEDTEFVVVGLTRGLAFTENPCLDWQFQWVLDRGAWDKPTNGAGISVHERCGSSPSVTVR